MELRHKVFAYITYGGRLLVFDQPRHPEAGTQVPAGTRPEDEPPDVAVLREAEEETGLGGLVLLGFLGERDFPVPGLNQVHRRRFYHIGCPESPSERWHHYERLPSDGTTTPILFELYWVNLFDAVPPLAPGHDAMLEELISHMNSYAQESAAGDANKPCV